MIAVRSLSPTELHDPLRLQALQATGPLATGDEPALDRMTRLVCRSLNVPAAIISLVDDDRQVFKSAVGIPEPWAGWGETPLSHSICRHAVQSGEELVLSDTRSVPELEGNAAVTELGMIAYAGIPLRAASGQVLGTLCAIDHQPRKWTVQELEILRDLAAVTQAEVQRPRQGGAVGEGDFRLLVENGWDVVHILDANGVVRYVSPAVERLLGLHPDQIVGHHSSEFIHPDDVERAQEALHATFAHREIHRCPELRLRHRDGSWRTVELIGRAASDATGAPLSIVNTHDITQRKQAEEALRQSEQRFQLVSRATEEVIRDWDVPQGTIEWNAVAHRVFRRPAGEMGVRIEWWCDQIHPQDRDRVVAGIHAVASGVSEFWWDEYQFRRGDGSYAAILDRACVVRDETGRPLRLISSMVDISDRKRAEEAQRFLTRVTEVLDASIESEVTLANLARLTVPALADCCVIHLVARDGSVQPAACAHLTPAQEQMLRTAGLFAPGAESGGNPVANVVHAGKSVLVSRVPLAPGDTSRRQPEVHSYVCVPLVAHGRTLGAITLATVTSERYYNTTDLLLAEELGRRAALAVDNARLYQQACQAIRARDDLLAIVSHDLRNPLNTIALSTSLLLDREPDRRTLTRRPLEVIKRTTDRMNVLLRDLLEISKIEAGGAAVELCRHTPAEIIRDACEMLNLLATEESLELRCECASAVPSIRVDADRILRVLSNLVGNALKFTPAGGRITVRAERDGDSVRFSVSDTGLGIPADHLPHLFDRFWQARRTDRRGAGLGLAIARGIVEAHHGRIWVESEVGKGTTFHFTVPTESRDSAGG